MYVWLSGPQLGCPINTIALNLEGGSVMCRKHGGWRVGGGEGVSDMYLINNCGILRRLLPGGVVYLQTAATTFLT